MTATSPAALLDADTSDTTRLTPDEAAALGERALKRIGYTGDDARIIVDQLVDNALCGYKFAGLPRILAIARDEKTRERREPVRVVHDTPLSALTDGGNNVGYVVAYHAARLAIEKAKKHGMASVGAYNSYFSGRNAYFVELLVREGLVGFHVASGRDFVLPPGAARPALGTNPICVGFPSEEGAVIVDMGTASMMLGDVSLHAQLGTALPGIGFDENGTPTRDAAAVLRGGVAPFGGYKGYALSFAIQALGLLAGALIPNEPKRAYGFLFWAIDPRMMLPGGEFKAHMSALVRKIKETPRQPGVDEIRIPSERANRERERRRTEGIVLEKKVVDALNAL